MISTRVAIIDWRGARSDAHTEQVFLLRGLPIVQAEEQPPCKHSAYRRSRAMHLMRVRVATHQLPGMGSVCKISAHALNMHFSDEYRCTRRKHGQIHVGVSRL